MLWALLGHGSHHPSFEGFLFASAKNQMDQQIFVEPQSGGGRGTDQTPFLPLDSGGGRLNMDPGKDTQGIVW